MINKCKFCHSRKYCSLNGGDCCKTCIYSYHNCLITGDLVTWCKAYAEIDPHERLARMEKSEN